MKKKVLISIFSIVVVVALIVVLISTVFSLQSVQFFFVNEDGDYVNVDVNDYGGTDVENSLSVYYGKSILFLKKKSLTNDVEKKYEWMKVLGVESDFPNSMRIYASIRIPVFCFMQDEEIYYCDNTGYVMYSDQKIPSYINHDKKVINVSGIERETVAIGAQLKGKSLLIACELISSLWRQPDYKYTYSNIPYTIEAMTFIDGNVIIKTSVGAEIIIDNVEHDTHKKFTNAYTVFLNSSNQISGTFRIFGTLDSNGNYYVVEGTR